VAGIKTWIASACADETNSSRSKQAVACSWRNAPGSGVLADGRLRRWAHQKDAALCYALRANANASYRTSNAGPAADIKR